MRARIVSAMLLAALVSPTVTLAQTSIYDAQSQLQGIKTRLLELQKKAAQQKIITGNTAQIPTGSSHCPVFWRTLRLGMNGGDVGELQNFLIAQGYLASDTATGYFGPTTEDALKRWQAKEGLVSSGASATGGWGIVGPKTRTAIASACTASHGTAQQTATNVNAGATPPPQTSPSPVPSSSPASAQTKAAETKPAKGFYDDVFSNQSSAPNDVLKNLLQSLQSPSNAPLSGLCGAGGCASMPPSPSPAANAAGQLSPYTVDVRAPATNYSAPAGAQRDSSQMQQAGGTPAGVSGDMFVDQQAAQQAAKQAADLAAQQAAQQAAQNAAYVNQQIQQQIIQSVNQSVLQSVRMQIQRMFMDQDPYDDLANAFKALESSLRALLGKLHE